MNRKFEAGSIRIEFNFDKTNNAENVFGQLHFYLDNILLTSNSVENLGYFYVDCESLLIHLKNNPIIKNPLADCENKRILQLYQEWLDYNPNNQEESENVIYFDRNYFKTGSPFTSYFFDEKMIFYSKTQDHVKIKIWNKTNPKKIFDTICSSKELENALNFFIDVFDREVKRLKNVSIKES